MIDSEIMIIVIFLALILSFVIGTAFGVTMAERNQKTLKELIKEVHEQQEQRD